MRIIAYDPSTTGAHWAIVDVHAGRAPSFVGCGVLDMGKSAPFDPALGPIDLVAVETPAGFVYEHARGKHLIATAVMAGKLAGACMALGYRVVEHPAAQWRLALCGRARRAGTNLTSAAGDDEVKRAVAGVEGLPTRTNAHVRDAIGLAIFAGRTAVGRAA